MNERIRENKRNKISEPAKENVDTEKRCSRFLIKIHEMK